MEWKSQTDTRKADKKEKERSGVRERRNRQEDGRANNGDWRRRRDKEMDGKKEKGANYIEDKNDRKINKGRTV